MRGARRFLRDEAAASAAEYGLILGIVIVVGATAIIAFAPGVETLYSAADETVAQNANATAPDDGEGSEIEQGQ